MSSDDRSGDGSERRPGNAVSRSDDVTALLGNAGSGGRVVANRYRVVRRLGLGGFGEVFEALDTTLGRRVALKILRSDRLTPDNRSRFLSEARATAKLRHPNVALLYDVLDDGGEVCLVLEFVSGEPLDVILQRGAISSERALAIACDVLAGLEAAHALRIVHRDVKPSNILITPEGVARLTDFGIARLLDESSVTKTDAIVGTPSYMAPEQLEGERATKAADYWALGCVLHEMLSGRRAFEATSTYEAVAAILAGKSTPLPEPANEVDDQAQRITKSLLSNNPADRSAGVQSLRARMGGPSAGAVETSRIAARSTGARKAVPIAVALVLLLVAGVFYVRGKKAAHTESARLESGTLSFDFRSFEEQYWREELGTEGVPLNLSLESAPIFDLYREVADQTKMNLFIAPSTPRPTVSAHIKNLAWPLALRSVLDEQKLAFVVEGSLLLISTQSEAGQMATTQMLVFQTQAGAGTAFSEKTVEQWLSPWGRLVVANQDARRLWFVEDLPIRVAFVADCLQRAGVIEGTERMTVSTWTCPWRVPQLGLPKRSALLIAFRRIDRDETLQELGVKGEDLRRVIPRLADPTGLSYRIDSNVRGKVTATFRAVRPSDALDALLRMNGLTTRCDGSVLVIEYSPNASPAIQTSLSMRHFSADATAPLLMQFADGQSKVTRNPDGMISLVGSDGFILRSSIVANVLDQFAAQQ